MAELSEDQITYLQDHLGSGTDTDDLQTRYNRLGALDLVIVEVLQRRLADLLSKPASFSVPDYSQNTGPNIEALTKKLAQFGATGEVSGFSTVRIVKPARADCR